ncbi:helix-turn-helix domain-containing protein [Actinokineospora sp. HUAS TT18]|uniref:helix-turn-helix domain-containing protein n=1 Tax=Actinokineospora sp. HUAS TT18 TaxID=3447451 RepID=UPI003F51E2D8
MGERHRAVARELGMMLREQRNAAGLTLVQLSARVGHPVPTLFRMETGERGNTSEVDVVHYLAACGAGRREVRRLTDFFREVRDQRGYWICPNSQWISDSLRSLILHEATADRFASYDPEVIPGLLQTEPYIRSLFADFDLPDDEMDALVDIRVERQRIMFRQNPARFTFFIHERVLRMALGDCQIMTEQLRMLLMFGEHRHIGIRVVPSAARGKVLFGGTFKYLGYRRHKPLVCLDATMGTLFLEDPKYVDPFRALLPNIANVALPVGESRALIAKLADEYDRAEGNWDDERRVAQEQP